MLLLMLPGKPAFKPWNQTDRGTGGYGIFVHGILLQHVLAIPLCLPDPLDSLSDTNIVGLKFVKAPAADEDHEEVGPVGKLADDRNSPGREVVCDAVPMQCQYTIPGSRFKRLVLLETHVRVDDEQANEGAVEQRVERASSERHSGQRDDSDRDSPIYPCQSSMFPCLDISFPPISHLSKLQW